MFKLMITKAFLAKATAVLAGLGLATTGAGAADVLPQVAQDRVAAAVEKVSTLDLPDSSDTTDGAETADDADTGDTGTAEKPEDTGKPEDAAEPGEPKENFGSIVSARAHSTEDKGREFGQWVSTEAKARAAARREAKAAEHPIGDQDADQPDAQQTSEPQRHGRPDTPGTQGNRGSGQRR